MNDIIKNNQEFELLMLQCDIARKTLMTSIEGQMTGFEVMNGYNPVEHIKSRIKSEQSIMSKLKRYGCEITFSNIASFIHDIVGVRIVCSFLSDVYDIVKILKQSRQFEIVKEIDYIKEPKETGYTSYHLIVKVPVYLNGKKEFIHSEIQIRTVAMDFWASLDHKIQYKFEGEVPKVVVEEMLRCSQEIRKLDHRMLDLNMTVNRFFKDK